MSPSEDWRGEAGFGSRARVTISVSITKLRFYVATGAWIALVRLAVCMVALGTAWSPRLHGQSSPPVAVQSRTLPPRVAAARRFMAQRGWPVRPRTAQVQRPAAAVSVQANDAGAGTAAWQPLGPTAVSSLRYGLVTGRISAMAFDPADATGNRLYMGTTGGGVWLSENASTGTASNIVFTPMTDSLQAIVAARDASISIGALTVQPGATGVVLAGTGDPNDAMDSYYGAGILRSTDGGTTWSLIATTANQWYTFAGEGFAGFAWSTVNPQVVVAAVSQAYEGTLVNAEWAGASYPGLYYSTDSGATWTMATLKDGATTLAIGNAATAVVWNQLRHVFVAAVRYHGYYQSTDGATWTRLTAQPGAGLTTSMCPANTGGLGSVACPIFRGSLAVNATTGDTFAWTVDVNNQDQGLWQDACGLSSGICASQTMSFGTQWSTVALQTNTTQGATTILNGDYTLALAAVPQGQDTMLLAGNADLWKCNLATGCVWRNTTNAFTCAGAGVAPYPHALGWSAANPLEVFVGNDSGLWRSTDGIAETGSVCSAADAAPFNNLNGSLGSLAESESVAVSPATPYKLLAGLGVNGAAGVKSTSGAVAEWPEILSGQGGLVAMDQAGNWYVNNSAGVSIHVCTQSGDCTEADFGTTPAVGQSDVSGDGTTMTAPAAFVVDPLDPTQLLVGTCRVWRGPASGGWTSASAISGFLDGVAGKSYCNGDALVRTLAAMPIGGGSEVVYAGMYGALNGGGTTPGYVFRAVVTPGGSAPVWQDLTFHPVSNDGKLMNHYAEDISGIAIDPHDATGNTVYVAVAGVPNPSQPVITVYRSTDGGAHWASVMSNLPFSPANAVVVDPQDANTVYVATDAGVYATRQISNCTSAPSNCWARFGTGLPNAPAVTLSVSQSMLVTGTYGRGIWLADLWSTGTQLTTGAVSPASLTFASQAYGTTSAARSVTLTNTGSAAMSGISIAVSGDFGETDNCTSVSAGASCTIQVSFTPGANGTRTGTLAVNANLSNGPLTVALSGTGTGASAVYTMPTSLDFGQVQVGTASTVQSATLNNTSASAISISSVSATAPFSVASNACGSTLAANASCQIGVTLTPVQKGAVSGTLSLADSAGTQTVVLKGSGAAAATDTLSPGSLTFAATPVGQLSATQNVTLTNSGDLPLGTIAVSVSGPFQISSGCGTALPGNSSCAIGVQYAPAQAGAQTGTLTLDDALGSKTVALSGTGIAAPVLTTSPTQLSFGTQTQGVASAARTVTITNAGGSVAANIGFQVAGANSASFAVASTTCGATLAAGVSCTAGVVFTPQGVGSNVATLVISSSTTGVTAAQTALSGTGQSAAGINAAPAQLTFTVATLGQASAAQTVTVTNSGALAATGLTLTTASPFDLTANTCGTSLAAGASCTVGVTFTPQTNGSFSGSLTVASATYTAAVVSLTGQGGLAGAVRVLPALLTFASTGVGMTSTAQTVTVTNTGGVALGNLALSASAGFAITGTTCASSLAVGVSCTASVAFAPAAAGQQNGTLSVTSSDLPAAAQVALSGMGFDFTWTTVAPSSQSAASGQATQFKLTLTPLNGSSGTFAFACGSLPAHSMCSFNPTSATVPASNSQNITLTVTTGVATAAVEPPRVAPAREAPFALCLVLLPLALRRRRKALLWAALLAVAIAGVSGCAGAGGNSTVGGGGGRNATPPGTYTINVTASASGLSHATSVTLTVD